MKDPTRLVTSPDATDFEKALLTSWDECPSEEARANVLAKLGLASTTVAATAAGSLAPKAAVSWLAIGKWTTLALFLGGATLGSLVAATLPVKVSAMPNTTTVRVVAETSAVGTSNVTPPPPLEQAAKEASQHRSHRGRPLTSSSLADEVAALDRARVTLTNGDGAATRKLIDAYEATYPNGAFAQEAEVLRIESFVHDGDADTAERAGKRFINAHPNSPHVTRINALLGSH